MRELHLHTAQRHKKRRAPTAPDSDTMRAGKKHKIREPRKQERGQP